jgi:hypothetical protein
MGRHSQPNPEEEDIIRMYTCVHCGQYGDGCGCGPDVFGCNGAEECPVDWHTHGCYNDLGNCDEPEKHLPTHTMPIVIIPPGGFSW